MYGFHYRSVSISYLYRKLHFFFLFTRDGDKEKPPVSFFVVRVTSKPPPCLVIRLAFLGGMPGHTRNQVGYVFCFNSYSYHDAFLIASLAWSLQRLVNVLSRLEKGDGGGN